MHRNHCRYLTTIKGAHYERVRYQHETSKFVRSYRAELEQQGTTFLESLVTTDTQNQETIWRNVCKLNHLCDEEWSTFRRNKVLKEMHDYFFRLEMNREVSKPNFGVCVKLCCSGCSPGSSKERSVLLASESVFNSFDCLRRGLVNWRLFVFYMQFLSDPTLSCKEHLTKAFITISGTDEMDVENAREQSSTIDLQHLASILFPLVKISAMETVLSAFDEAWAQVNVLTGRNSKQSNNNITKISLHLFEKMLNQRVIQRFFTRSSSLWGRGDIFPVFVCRWEEEFFNVTLLNVIKKSRREHAIRDKLVRDDQRKRRLVYQCWLEFATYQKTLRKTFDAIDHMVASNLKARGHGALSAWRTKQFSACDMQRVGRGFLGRIKARKQFLIIKSTTLIQTRLRIHLARQKLKELLSRYLLAANKVQCVARGTLARRLALKRLMTLVEEERKENANEMKRYALERGIWCLTRLQSHLRRKNAVVEADQLRQQRQRESEVRHAMESRNAAFRRERKLYQRQLEAFYQQLKEDHDTNEKKAAKVLQDKRRLRMLQRRIKNEELKRQEPDRVLEENLATEKWKQEWLAKIENDVVKCKEYYVNCLDIPVNSREKKTRSITKKRINKRLAEVLQRADAQNIPMETKEARVIAREEVLHMIGEEEREKLLLQMKMTFAKREHDKESLRIQAESANKEANARATVFAATVVAAACRRWLAKRELRRLCSKRYEKKYDAVYHTFYYENKLTGELSWTKPNALGACDIPAKNEWVVLRDMHDFPYYFNPSTYEIRWVPPLDVAVCGGTILHTWWRDYPFRSGSCPNFACCLNEEDGIRYCRECFDRLAKTNVT